MFDNERFFQRQLDLIDEKLAEALWKNAATYATKTWPQLDENVRQYWRGRAKEHWRRRIQ